MSIIKNSLYETINAKTKNENSIVLANMDKIAIEAGLSHRSMNKLINRYNNDLKESGQVRTRVAPDNTRKKTYLLDSAQCAYIVTRMNRKGASKLQKQISNVFAYRIHQQIERQAVHQLSKDAVKSFCDAIKYYLDDPAGYMYGHLTNLAYKYALGVGVKKMQTFRGAKGTSNKKNYLYPDEIELLSKAMNKIEMLLELGYKYYDIKKIVSNNCLSKTKITVKLNSNVHE